MPKWQWDENGELEGRFWLPETSDDFYGRLLHDPRDGPRFHFFGCPTVDPGSREAPLPPECRLLGESPGGGRLTVDGFFPTNWTQYGLPVRDATVDGFARSLLDGCHLAPDQPLELPVLTASLWGLKETLIGAATDTDRLLNPHGQLGQSGFAKGEDLTIELPGDVALSLHAGEQPSFTRHAESTEVVAQVQVDAPGPIESDEVERRYLVPIKELITFATRRPSYVRKLAFHARDDPMETVSVLRRPWPLPRGEPRDLYRLGFNLGRIEDAAATIRRWFALREEVGPVWALYFATLGREEGLLENRFLNLMAFAEGYHRALRDTPPLTKTQDQTARQAIKGAVTEQPARDIYLQRLAHANSQTQRERITELSEQGADLLGEAWEFDAREFSRATVDTRNWMTHWGSRTRSVNDEPQALAAFSAQLELVLYIAIMRDLGLEDDDMLDAVGHGWVLEGLP